MRHYSLGMRQRLGIAHALLGDPEVLILDEPANGLDPPGIRWMRELLRDFADRGGTVLLSSHLLHEVQALADRVVIIDLGRIVAEGSLAELLGELRHGRARRRRRAAAFGARRRGPRGSPRPRRRVRRRGSARDVGRAALAGGVALSRLAPSDGSGLEQLFFDLTAGAANGGRATEWRSPHEHRRPRIALSRLTSRGVRASCGSPPSSCGRWSTPVQASGCC